MEKQKDKAIRFRLGAPSKFNSNQRFDLWTQQATRVAGEMDAAETQLEVEDEHLQSQIPSLPQEIIADILSRLPVKSVCKFRCVSKLWLSITSDPIFAQAHLRKTLKDANFSSPSLRVLVSSNNLYSVNYESISVADDEIVVQELDCPVRDWVHILGSCNGLACIDVEIVTQDSLFLFNPTTGESKRIPDLEWKQKKEFLLCFHGFGYDEVHDDYKVVKLISGTSMIYSARSDAWKRVAHGYETYETWLVQVGTFLDGAIHWVFSSNDEMGGNKRMVVVLDLATETFWDMPAPDEVEGRSKFSTASLNGCLYLLHSRNVMQDQLWLMTEYGVGESWTKVTISISYTYSVWPRFLAPTGEMLLQVDTNLVLYNHGDHSSRKLVIRGNPSMGWFEAHVYVESLISPNGFSRSHTYQVQK